MEKKKLSWAKSRWGATLFMSYEWRSQKAGDAAYGGGGVCVSGRVLIPVHKKVGYLRFGAVFSLREGLDRRPASDSADKPRAFQYG